MADPDSAISLYEKELAHGARAGGAPIRFRMRSSLGAFLAAAKLIRQNHVNTPRLENAGCWQRQGAGGCPPLLVPTLCGKDVIALRCHVHGT